METWVITVDLIVHAFLISCFSPSKSTGAPLALGWKSNNEVVEDIDFFEYCRKSERKSRRKDLILSNRKRTTILLEEGYGIEEVLKASMACEMIKQSRADSLRAFGWNNPMELLSGAAETTGSAIKAIDILGVGTAAGAVVGAGAAVVNVGADVTIQTGRMLVNGVTTSTKVVTDGFTNVGGAVMSSVRKLSPKRS
jgi:hypothetical protein